MFNRAHLPKNDMIMNIDKFEAVMLKDALIEYWHNNIKHSKDEQIKEKYKSLMADFKTVVQTKGTFTFKIK